MNTYLVNMTLNPITGDQAVGTTVTAHTFVFNEDYVLFADDQNDIVLAVPLSREPVITRTAVGA